MPAPRREPESVTGLAHAAGASPGGDGTARAVAWLPDWETEKDSLIWFAVYLSAFPGGLSRPALAAAAHRWREMAGRGRPSALAEPGQAAGAPHGRPGRLE